MKFSRVTWTLIVLWFLVLVFAVFNLLRLAFDYTELEANYNSVVVELAEMSYQERISSDREYLGEFTVTHYDACLQCCGKTDGITKSGAKVCEGVTVAVDPSVIPLGTYIYIEGVGYRVAQDIGGAIKGNKIDVYVCSHSKAWELGRLDNIKVWRMK